MARTLSRAEARRLLLAYHHLLPPRNLRADDGITRTFDRLRTIQVDPLDVVARNVHLVLQSRIAGYRESLLDAALYGDFTLVEAWDKVRSIVRTQEWQRLTPFRERMRETHERSQNPPQDVIDYVRSAIRESSPLSSLDLEDHGEADWRWAPARAVRAALEIMFDWGEIGIVARTGGRKLYAPIDRIIPDHARSQTPLTHDEYLVWHVEQRVRSLGLAADRNGDHWIGIEGFKAAQRTEALGELVDRGSVVEVAVEGVRQRCIVARGALELAAEEAKTARAAFIAPLDNVLWDRRLILELFDFAYTWEVYKPTATREYGYYVLPVLLGDRFVARWEPRREKGDLIVRGWWWERDERVLRDDADASAAIGAALADFMDFLELERLRAEPGVTRADERFLKRALREARAAR